MFDRSVTIVGVQASVSMPRAKLAVHLPEGIWIHGISTANPDVTFRVSSVMLGSNSATGIVELTTSNPVPILAAIDDRADVEKLELLWKHDEMVILQVETTDPSLLTPMQRAGVPIRTPFELEDGTVRWELTTSSDRLSALNTALEKNGIQYNLEYVHELESGRARRLLTDRQLEVFLTAMELGYYDVPRDATLTEVASTLDVTKSTCSDVLHRAESAVARWFAEECVD